MNKAKRKLARENWVNSLFAKESPTLTPVAGDASFRSYFRIKTSAQNYILMDAPPKQEDCRPFVHIANAAAKQGICVPTIFEKNLDQGFLLLSDFGDTQLLDQLDTKTADLYYHKAIDTLLHWQQVPLFDVNPPAFDNKLLRYEFDLFLKWYLQTHCNCSIDNQMQIKFTRLFDTFSELFKNQPHVFVHRDYHARNIMVCEHDILAILDFQDAVKGPITYDLVSLLRDCYIDWPDTRIANWVSYYYNKLESSHSLSFSLPQFMHWFDWTGLQRHLKCLGIFSRLAYRDNKKGYLEDIPRVLNYVLNITKQYDELQWLHAFLRQN